MNKLPDLEPFFHQDVLDLKEYPSDEVWEKVHRRKVSTFDFSEISEPLKSELKHYLQDVLLKDVSHTTLSQSYLTPMLYLIGFLSERSEEFSLKGLSESLESEYKRYLQQKGISVQSPRHEKSISLLIFERVHKFVRDLYNGDDPFDKDIWKLDEMGIDQTRFIESNKRKTFDFSAIPNQVNRNLAKKYIKYLISTTDKAISTIYSKLTQIKTFLTFLDRKDINDIQRGDIEEFILHLNNKGLEKHSYNICIFINKNFVEYLIVNGDLSTNSFYSQDIKSDNRKHTFKTVDDYTIKQIFEVLDKVPFKESCMYLLLYSTGMRVSEVCALKKNALFSNENGYFVRFYSQKMRKEVVNPIPNSLYELLIKQKQGVLNENTKYLFPYHNLGCYPSGAYRERMQMEFKALGIKNPDGTPYQFRPHDYRHTLATTMILHDIPSYVVQKILHHDTLEMSVFYIDIQDQQKIKKHKEFINIKGESMPIHIDSSVSIDDIAKVEWLKKSINAQMLPNGMCSLPVAMGKCPHANSCLTCGEFRTSKEFLPVHEKHYQSVCSLLDYAKQQGWQRQIETNEEVKDNLETIIKKLKEEDKVGNAV